MSSYQASQTKSPSKSLQLVILFFGGLIACGPYYMSSITSTLQITIQNYFNINNADYNLFYSLGGLGQMFMPILGGYAIDHFGCRLILFLSLSMIVFGQIIMVLAIHSQSFIFMIVGRFVSMSFMDTSMIARYKMLCLLFYDRRISLITICVEIFIQIGIVLNLYITPAIYQATQSLTQTWFLSIGMTCFSWICGILFILIDKNIDLNKVKTDKIVENSSLKLREIFKLDKIIWIISLCGGLSIGASMTLFQNLNALLQRKFGYTQLSASHLQSTVLITSMSSLSFVAWYIYKKGMRSRILMISTVILNCGMLLIQLTPNCSNACVFGPLMSLLLLGCYFGSQINAIIASIPFLVRKELFGLALGVLFLSFNIFQICLPYIFGVLVDADEQNGIYSYTYGLCFLLFFSGNSLIFAFLVNKIDRDMGRPLNQLQPNDTYKLYPENEEKKELLTSLIIL